MEDIPTFKTSEQGNEKKMQVRTSHTFKYINSKRSINR